MKFRIARHTKILTPILTFYRDILGLQILGDFKGHDGYDGVFLGIPGSNWHLEFTVSDENPVHFPDDDDLLVFYTDSSEQYMGLLKNFAQNNIDPITPKNPYWELNGTTYTDPDDYRIVIAKAPNL